jgi:antirestriction protein
MQQHALTQGLAPDDSAEHARLLNDYVQALEGHKQAMRAAWNHDNGHPSAEAVERAWLADARIEATRRHLESFRSQHGIP